MTWGMVASAAVTVGASYLSKDSSDESGQAAGQAAGYQSGGANQAAGMQRENAERAINLSNARFSQMQEDLQPYKNIGVNSQALLSGYLGMGDSMKDDPIYGSLLKKYVFEQDPGYEFRQQQGQQGLERSAAARGGLFSGAAGKALDRYNQDYASNEYQSGFARDQVQKNQMYNMLMGPAALGQNAAVASGNAGINAAGQVGSYLGNSANAAGNYMTQGANAMASGVIGQDNARAGGVNSMLNQLGGLGGLMGGGGMSGGGIMGGGFGGGISSWFDGGSSSAPSAMSGSGMGDFDMGSFFA